MDTPLKRILILHASAGHGHLKAAQAVCEAIEAENINAVVELHDALDFVPRYIKKFYVSSYLFMITKAPFLWGWSYSLSDSRLLFPITRLLRRVVNGALTKRLVAKILQFEPHVVISTHFMAPEVCSDMKRRGVLNAKCITVVTDMMVHRFWALKETDLFCVALPQTKNALMRLGIEESRVEVTGIPVSSAFERIVPKEEVRAELGLPQDLYGALFTSGGMGANSIADMVIKICKAHPKLLAMVVCGNNKTLKEDLDKFSSQISNLKVYGFVNNMHDLMDASDVIVGKAGGLTSTEALAKKKIFFVLSPVPGQETYNAEILTKAEAALWLKDESEIAHELEILMQSKMKQERFHQAIDKIRTPYAAKNIARKILE